jgi:hypothetical protein
MCAQCMMGAMAAGAGATGARSWIAARFRLRPRTLKRLTIALVALGLVVAALIPGSGA